MNYLEDAMLTLHHGDCVEVMRELPAESVDAVVTDPPYGIRFMGKAWDGEDIERRHAMQEKARDARGDTDRTRSGWTNDAAAAGEYDRSPSAQRAFQAWCTEWAREAYRVAKPGAHLLAFGGTRTYHRLASAIEDAGWEIRDCLVWAYASGFPKSLDVSKAIDKAAGAERERIGDNPNARRTQQDYSLDGRSRNFSAEYGPVTAPATPDAARWDGWGTALKPAWEPIVLARKPLRGTVAANVLAHGTGALNIGATRIQAEPYSYPNGPQGNTFTVGADPDGTRLAPVDSHPAGRWPANLLLTDPIFDGGVPGVVGGGETNGGAFPTTTAESMFGIGGYSDPAGARSTDSGTYSRFFQIPRGEGCYLCGRARSVDGATSPQEIQPASAPSPAPTEGSSGTDTTTGSPTTNGTEQTSWHGDGESTPSTPRSRRRGTSPASTPPSSPAKSKDATDQGTGTTTTTADRWTCDICAALTTSAITFEPGDTRFLLVPKSSRSDREPLLRGTGTTDLHLNGAFAVICAKCNRQKVNVPGAACQCEDPEWVRRSQKPRENLHPTVKPLELMRHLVRLVTPPGGTVLDCFLGSGTTAIAANAEGFRCIGIEREQEYLDIAVARLAHQPLGLAL